MIKKMLFMRDDYARKRGQIADHPFREDHPIGTLKYHIVVTIDLTWFDISVIADPTTVTLKLPQLMARYPDSTEQYTVTDEDGNEETKTRIVYGYFDKLGKSTVEGERITIDDLEWDGK